MNNEFKCPLQVVYKKILGKETYDDYYNSNCFDCSNNRKPSEKSFTENITDLGLTFKVMGVMEELEKVDSMTEKEIFDEVAKRSGMYN